MKKFVPGPTVDGETAPVEINMGPASPFVDQVLRAQDLLSGDNGVFAPDASVLDGLRGTDSRHLVDAAAAYGSRPDASVAAMFRHLCATVDKLAEEVVELRNELDETWRN